ncbi:hypothetical protein EXIGLDRAFT_729530 [Exidia glandulosa HHB12029]|uniref:Uncharacterized protein n=1 Tax=Exidia glandulosa HHB12029 TaxID=1314781 RepID=A0A165CIX0_EXIGL|nr:hypothetical protein EXIGLDRAFT_729530 [Exidia glandulosa HHB12029]
MDPTTTASQSTRLDYYLADLPWVQGYKLGYGLNAVTGGVTTLPGVHLAPGITSTTLPKSPPSTTTTICMLSSAEEFKSKLGVSFGTSLNLLPLDCSTGAFASVKSLATVSATSKSMLVLYRRTWQDDDTEITWELTADAEALALADADAFRKTYGDYFIAGARWGTEFLAVATCTCTSATKAEQMESVLKAAVRQGAGIKFDLDIAARTDKELSSLNVDICINILSKGGAFGSDVPRGSAQSNINETVWSFVDLASLLETVKHDNGETGDRICALLRHYSVAVAHIPSNVIQPTVPIPYDVFEDIELLRNTVLDCGLLSNNLPTFLADGIVPSLKRRVMSFQRKIHRAQDVVATDAVLRAQLLQTGTALLKELAKFHEVHGRFYKLLRECQKEPGNKRHYERDSYGCGWNTVHSRPNLVIEEGASIDVNIHAWWPANNRKALLQKPVDGHIVGWMVEAHEPQLGSWRQLSASIILASQGMITCRREHAWRTWFRSCRWTFRIFVVRKNEFLDLFFQQSDHENKAGMMTLQTAPTKTPV